MSENSYCPTSSPISCILDILDFDHSDRWYLIVVLICSSLMTCELEHLFICLLAICISSLVRWLFRSFIDFLIRLFVFLLLNIESYLFKYSFIRCVFYKYFLLACCFSSHSLHIVFPRVVVFYFNDIQLISSFFMDCAFDIIPKKLLLYQRSSRFFFCVLSVL